MEQPNSSGTTTTATAPQEFLSIRDIDKLSVAGIGVFILTIVAQGIFPDFNAYKIRLIAITFSLAWSVCLFLQRKQWRIPFAYILIFINAGLIWVNAAGFNSVTKGDPLRGATFENDLDSIKQDERTQAGFLDFSNQKDWFPDYDMIEYIDTLKYKIKFERNKVANLKNLFYYFKDQVKTVSKDSNVTDLVNSFNLDNETDSSFLEKIRGDYQHIIDSLNVRLEADRRMSNIYKTYWNSASVTIDGENMTFNRFIIKSDSIKRANINLQNEVKQLHDTITNFKKQLSTIIKQDTPVRLRARI